MARRHHSAIADKDYGSRRLVVVAAFDVVGFSTLVEADQDNVLAAWRALRREIDPLIARGGGRIFMSLGDGLLVEYASWFDATRSALEVQAVVAKTTPEHGIRLQLRCAIHMGDVTVEGTDLLGDGINVVSRLQDHAPIGGVLVSAAIMDLISGRIDAPIKDLGTLQLRNISRPVHAYAVGTGKRPKTALPISPPADDGGDKIARLDQRRARHGGD
jgi:adenylate cyclase